MTWTDEEVMFWILGYLVVGFVYAVLWERYATSFSDPDAPPPFLFICLWPVCAAWFACTGLGPAIRWCAQRLP